MPTPLQLPGVAERLTSWGRLLGRLRLNLADEVLPVVQVADHSIASVPVTRRIAALQANQAAVAGELPTFSFQVPPSIIARIRRVTVTPAADDRVLFRLGSTINTAGYSAVNSFFLDERLAVSAGARPAGTLFRGTQVAGLANAPMVRWFSSTAPAPQEVDIFVGSGVPVQFGFLEIQAVTANQLCRLYLEWDEYQLLN